MTGTEMVILPKNLSIEMISEAAGEAVENTQVMGEFQDIYSDLIKASPNQGEVTKGKSRMIRYAIKEVFIKEAESELNEADIARLKADDAFNRLVTNVHNAVIKAFGLEVSDAQ